jgi:hypothetical protein
MGLVVTSDDDQEIDRPQYYPPEKDDSEPIPYYPPEKDGSDPIPAPIPPEPAA